MDYFSHQKKYEKEKSLWIELNPWNVENASICGRNFLCPSKFYFHIHLSILSGRPFFINILKKWEKGQAQFTRFANGFHYFEHFINLLHFPVGQWVE